MHRIQLLLLLVFATASTIARQPLLAKEPPPKANAEKRLVREIFVPFEDLNVLLEGKTQRVYLTREQYEELLAKAKQTPETTPPHTSSVLSADYTATVQQGRAQLTGVLEIDVLEDALLAVPLDLAGVGVRAATLDGKPAALGRADGQKVVLFVAGKGRHRLELQLVAPLQTSAAQQSLHWRLPRAAASRLRLTVPGNVDVRSGAEVVSREVEEDGVATHLELLPKQGDMSLVMTLNNRLLQTQRVVVARSVMVDEVTEAYERLHATVSLGVLHGGVDQFRFVVPEGFEVTDVTSPLLARWAVDTTGPQRILQASLRQATTETVVLNLSAAKTDVNLNEWSLPQFKPLDVDGQVAVVGLLIEDRLKAEQIAAEGLIPINTTVLTDALPTSVFTAEPGAPQIRPVAAFYAPQAEYGLSASVKRPSGKFRVTTNVLLVLDEKQQRVRGSFALLAEVDKLFAIDFSAEPDWQVTEVTAADGVRLPMERYPGEDGRTRIHVQLPRGAVPGQTLNVFFHAQHVPKGWLDDWQQKTVTFPLFVVSGAARDEGAIAVQALDDLVVRPDKLTQLTPLDDNEKAKYGLADVKTNLAYRYEGQPYTATVSVEGTTPWITARTYSFLKIEPDALLAHYEVAYDVQNARARRLSLQLPPDTPTALSIRGLDGVNLKEYDSQMVDGQRVWTAMLAAPQSGTIRLEIKFQQRLSAREPKDLALPLVRAHGVAYQSGVVAVEGNAELDVQVKTKARKVDIGELVDADYQVGSRLLGAYGYVGDPPEVKVDVFRRPGFELPATIVQRAEMITKLATDGRGWTAVRYSLRTKDLFLEVALPNEAKLWSARYDGKPIKPQREGESLLVSLGAAGENAVRQLDIVYDSPVDPVRVLNNIEIPSPTLLLRADRDSAARKVPVADLKWHLQLPTGYRVVQAGGTVFTDELPERISPAANAAGVLYVVCGGFLRPQAYHAGARRAQSQNNLHQIGMAFRHTRSVAKDASESMRRDLYHHEDDADYVEDVTGSAEGESKSEDRPLGLDLGVANGDTAEGGDEAPDDEDMLTFDEAERPERVEVMPQPDTEAMPPVEPDEVPPPAAGDEPPGKTDVADGPQIRRKKYPSSDLAKKKRLMLEGVRSLTFDFDQVLRDLPDEQTITFQSRGDEPRLGVTVVDNRRMKALAWGVALLVGLIGLMLTYGTVQKKARFVLAVAVVALLLPPVTGWEHELGPACELAFYAACLLVPYYLVMAIGRWIWAIVRSIFPARRRAAATAATALLLATVTAMTTAAPPETEDLPFEVRLVKPPKPVDVPADAIIIPYDSKSETGVQEAKKLLVPYDKYVQLWNRAYPDKKIQVTKPPTDYALAGAEFRATLEGDEYLLLTGHVDIDVYTDSAITVPLPLVGGVLARASLNGKPARLHVVQVSPKSNAKDAPRAKGAAEKPDPKGIPGSFVALDTSGKGRQRLDLAIRLRLAHRGGWRVATGRVPAAPATALTLQVPLAQTEVTLSGVLDRGTYETEAAGEQIETALGHDGALTVQWRPKAGEGQIDKSLTATSDAVLDVREDGLRLAWRLKLTFGRGERESFVVTVPRDYLVEKVAGDNVRGWRSRLDEQDQRLDVTLLKPARKSETFTIYLSPRKPAAPDKLGPFDTPRVTVGEAVLHGGRLTIRRSPLLQLHTVQIAGMSRTDVPADVAKLADRGNGAWKSPLGIHPFQAYRFDTMPFTLQLSASEVESKATAQVQSVLKIAGRETTLESRVNVRVQQQDRPVYRLRCSVPADLKIDRVRVQPPVAFESSEMEEGERKILSVYLASGQQASFSVFVEGTLGSGAAAGSVAIPRLEILDVTGQEGDIVIQVDPVYDVSAQDLVHCERILAARVHGWLNEGQRRLVRLALRYRSSDYSGSLKISPCTPQVSYVAVTNVRVTDRTIEETILLEFNIKNAGIRNLSFLLPKWMEDSRISVPLLRQKTIEPVEDALGGDGKPQPMIRVRLQLQDEMMDQFSVIVQNDRLLTPGKHTAPIPIVETGQTSRHYVALESLGLDEIVVDEHDRLEVLSRQLEQWQTLADILKREITRAYVVRDNTERPRLVFHTTTRAAVETAGATIGLAEADLYVDGAGVYRGTQIYRMNNRTEQFLEVELPEGARLWTAMVAGQPVKPTKVPKDTSGRLLRVPLIKTAAGDRDFAVRLQYGGKMSPPRNLRKVTFPFPNAKNVNVQMSQVRLHLPRTHRWFNFAGSMRLSRDQGDLLAHRMAHVTKQLRQASEILRSSNEYDKARVMSNIKVWKSESEALQDAAVDYNSNTLVLENYDANAGTLLEIDEQLQQNEERSEEVDFYDNRYQLNTRWAKQKLSRARNVVQDAGQNWTGDVPTHQADQDRPQPDDQRFSRDWLKYNQLDNAPNVAKYTKGDPKAKKGKGRAIVWNGSGQVQGQAQGEGQITAQPQAAGVATGKVKPEPQKPGGQQETPSVEFNVGGTTVNLGKQRDVQQRAQRYQERLEEQNADIVVLTDGLNMTGGVQLEAGIRGATRATEGLVSGERAAITAFSPDGKRTFTTASADGTVTLWDDAGRRVMPAGHASLDVEFDDRGVEYVFTTARGTTHITARPIATSLLDRLIGIGWIALGVVVLVILYRVFRAIGMKRLTSPIAAVILIVAGLGGLCLLPLAGLAAIVTGIVLLTRSAVAASRRTQPAS